MSVEPEPKRLRLSEIELSDITKDELLVHWANLEKYMDHLETKASTDGQKESSELVSLRESEEKLKQQQAEATRRENVLVMRLTTKEQEMQEYAGQIQELKRSQVPGASQLRSSLLDPAVNLMFERMKKGLDTTKAKLEDTQNDLSAWKFTPDSNTGKRLMAKCRLLHQENEELGKMISSGRVAKLEGDLALQRNFSEEMKKSQADLDEFLMELDEDVEGMQSTIYYLQQQLRESKEAVTKLQQENLLLKSPVLENEPTTAEIAMDLDVSFPVAAPKNMDVCPDKSEISADQNAAKEEQGEPLSLKNNDDAEMSVADVLEEATTGSVSATPVPEGERDLKTTPTLSVLVDREANLSPDLEANQSPSSNEEHELRTQTPPLQPPLSPSEPFRTSEESIVDEHASIVVAESVTKTAIEGGDVAEEDEEDVAVKNSEDIEERIEMTVDSETVNNGDSLLACPESNVEELVVDCRSTENGHLEEEEAERVEDADDGGGALEIVSRTQSPRTPVDTPPPKESFTPPPPQRGIADNESHSEDDSDDDGGDDEDSDRGDESNNPNCLHSKKATLNGLADIRNLTATIGDDGSNDGDL